jgi:hypothetical protein
MNLTVQPSGSGSNVMPNSRARRVALATDLPSETAYRSCRVGMKSKR